MAIFHKMPVSERAKQFMPFSALTGLHEILAARETIIVPKADLSPDMADIINERLHMLKVNHIVSIIHFDNTRYIKTTGMIAAIDTSRRFIRIVDTCINFDDIYDIIL